MTASAEAFYDLLADELRQRYPGADIEVVEHHVTPSEWNRVHVETTPDSTSFVAAEETAQVVSELAGTLWEDMERWVVPASSDA